MSKESFEQTLRDSATRLLPKLHDYIGARRTTESFAVTIEQIARWAGLTRRNGRIDDNQTYRMLQLAGCPALKARKWGMRCWDAREALEALARWSGNYQWLV